MMRILVVEDDAEFSQEVLAIIGGMPGTPEATLARSRDSATEFLEDVYFDLLILDLTIPAAEDDKDRSALHGHHVFRFARTIAPGTPIIVLTGSPAEDFVPTMLNETHQVDIWKTGVPISTIQFIRKVNFDTFPNELLVFVEAVNALSEVEIDSPELELSEEYSRLLRIFARGCNGARCVVSRLGGLSSAIVVRLNVTDTNGAKVHDAVVKLDDIPSVEAEDRKYNTLVARLDAAATPRKLEMLHYGAKARGGVFYQLANADFTENGFSIAQQNVDAADSLPTALAGLLAPWSEGVPQSPRTVEDIRKRLLTDDDLALVVQSHHIDWVAGFEDGRAQTTWCCVHGDLHGENVLATLNAEGVLIDYGDVGEGPKSLDAITLEFSLLFHPKSPFVNGQWPSKQQAAEWFDLDRYLVDCPCPRFVKSTRRWATAAAAGNREIAATAYAYFMRQLKYDTTDGTLALALLAGARSLYNTT